MNNTEPITFTDEPNAVTIRITGAAYDNLKEIASIFNGWSGDALTPAETARRFLFSTDDIATLAERNPAPDCQTLAGAIVDEYDACGTDVDELKAAFRAAGFSTAV